MLCYRKIRNDTDRGLITTQHHLHDLYKDILSNDVTRQLLQQIPGDLIRLCVQRSNEMMLGCIDRGAPASVPDHITLWVDSQCSSSTGYLYPMRHEFPPPRRPRTNETFVIITHQSAELCTTDLHSLKEVDIETKLRFHPCSSEPKFACNRLTVGRIDHESLSYNLPGG